jgi:hypothetical protein
MNSEPRKPGALKGKIVVAPDFDELAEDVPEEFTDENQHPSFGDKAHGEEKL